jgi:hypothetical protein
LTLVATGARTVFLALAIAIRGSLLHVDEGGLGGQGDADTGDARDLRERALDRAGASVAHHGCGEFETKALHIYCYLVVLLVMSR